ncbi:MAG: glycosyltransferase [Gammaproteobacteria bacterium]|nr:glycosyltransferase [Gammaproteobacteria bacterium]
MKFSVITVCYNSAATLPEAMQSLAAQQMQDYEWVVVDGASSDGTQDIAASFSGPRGAFVSERDGGIYAAMNKGVSLARGEFLYFLNSDDRLSDAQVLGDVAATLAARPELELLYGNVIYIKPDGRVLRRFDHIDRGTLRFEDLCHQAVFAHRELFERLGGFNERFRTNADYDWLLRVFASGAMTAWTDRTVGEFRTGGAHMRDLPMAMAERRAVRLQYMGKAALAWGDFRRRVRHRLHILRHGHRPGQVPLPT